jgi:hypothetical protein
MEATPSTRITEEKRLALIAAGMGKSHISGLKSLVDHPLAGQVRGAELIAADKGAKRPSDPLGKVDAYFFERGDHHGLPRVLTRDKSIVPTSEL